MQDDLGVLYLLEPVGLCFCELPAAEPPARILVDPSIITSHSTYLITWLKAPGCSRGSSSWGSPGCPGTTDTHTCIHVCMHPYIHTHIHACSHVYMHGCIHTYMHAYIHACIHTCIHTHTCMPASAACLHSYTPPRCACPQMGGGGGTPLGIFNKYNWWFLSPGVSRAQFCI